MTTYEIWAEGYIDNGGRGTATLLGVMEGKTFEDACKRFAKTNVEFAYYFNSKTMTFWGCGLYDNYADAARSFG